MKTYREDRKFIKRTFNFYKEVLYSTIHEKVAACYELSVLAEMVLKMNGVKNCGKASLLSNTGERMNHCVTYVQLTEKFNPKKTIIIDPYLQDADFLPNMLKKYKNEYKKYFKNISDDTKLELNFIPERPLEKEEMDFLKKKYPNLILSNKLFEKNINK